ncbi:hypothetical protein [Burkholderia gladioli]|uniref:hypothetical protein n=1 Tax=Burkholderia gladioli TaxID=28095 RepID=UPI001FC82348|nr:hypothetical protein [Burkholderia gladioli]
MYQPEGVIQPFDRLIFADIDRFIAHWRQSEVRWRRASRFDKETRDARRHEAFVCSIDTEKARSICLEAFKQRCLDLRPNVARKHSQSGGKLGSRNVTKVLFDGLPGMRVWTLIRGLFFLHVFAPGNSVSL